jgi:hypothetical protein
VSCSSKEAVTYSPLCSFARPDPVDLVDQPLPRIVDEKRFVVLVGRLVHHRLFPAHLGFGEEDRCGHADLFAFDRIAERRLFAEDRANDTPCVPIDL